MLNIRIDKLVQEDLPTSQSCVMSWKINQSLGYVIQIILSSQLFKINWFSLISIEHFMMIEILKKNNRKIRQLYIFIDSSDNKME